MLPRIPTLPSIPSASTVQKRFDDAMAALLIRLALGILFLVAGLFKFLGPGAAGFMQWIVEEYRNTFLPAPLLKMYGYVLPFLETTIGLFLIAGLYRRTALLGTGLVLLSLSFGKALTADYQTVAQIYFYIFLTAWAIKHTGKDQYCLDCVFHR